MNTKITFDKLDIPLKPEPNTATPKVDVFSDTLLLSFSTNVYNTEGKIIFNEPLMYRIGDPNDEGFFDSKSNPKIKNDSIYSFTRFPDLEFNAFYIVKGYDWKNSLLGKGTNILNEEYKNISDCIHFVFFMKDGTFECIARSYKVL
jgi:hypothetical protein